MRNQKFAMTVLGLGLLALPQLASAAPKSLTSCRVINQPGSYLVASSLTSAAATCFRIVADDVKIDLGGHVLTGRGGTLDDTQSAITDDGGARMNVEITNGAIVNWRRAIELGACTGCKVSHTRIDSNGDGINIGNSAHVHHNTVLNSGDDGIHAKREALIHDNISNGNGSEGIEVEKNSIVKNNVTQDNDGAGLDLQCPLLLVQNLSYQNSPNETNTGNPCIFVDNLL